MVEHVKVFPSSDLIAMQNSAAVCHTMWVISVCWSPTPLGYGSCLTVETRTSSPRVTIPKFVAEVGLGQTV